MAKKFRVGNAILAEYVTKGDRNKHVLVNVYSGDVIVNAFPVDLGFGFYVEILRPTPDAMPPEFSVQLSFGNSPILRGRASGSSPIDSPTIIFFVPHLQFTASEPGEIEITLSAPGFQKTTALKKRIYQDVFS